MKPEIHPTLTPVRYTFADGTSMTLNTAIPKDFTGSSIFRKNPDGQLHHTVEVDFRTHPAWAGKADRLDVNSTNAKIAQFRNKFGTTNRFNRDKKDKG